MALAVNGRRLNLAAKEGEEDYNYVQEVLAGINKLEKEYKFPILLKYPEHFYIYNPEKPNKPEKKAGVYIKYTDTVLGKDNIPQQWQYFKSEKFLKDNTFSREPAGFSFTGSLLLNRIDADLAFFLMFKNSRCGNSLNDKIKNDTSMDKYFLIENKQIEAREKLKKDADYTDAAFMVKSESSPIKEPQLRELALAYGVTSAEKKDDDTGEFEMSLQEVRMGLWNILKSEYNYNKNTYHSFLVKLRDNKGTEYMAIVRRLMNDKLIAIRYTGKGGSVRIFHYVTEGEKGEDIYKCKAASETVDECVLDLSNKMAKDKEFAETLTSLQK